jgi:hypothetical protein
MIACIRFATLFATLLFCARPLACADVVDWVVLAKDEESIRAVVLQGSFDEQMRADPQTFLPWLANHEIPLILRTHVAVCLSESSNISNDDYLKISGWLYNHLRERSLLSAAVVLIRVWKTIPAQMSDQVVYEKLIQAGWNLPHELYVTYINGKAKDLSGSKSLRIFYAQPGYRKTNQENQQK